MPNDKSTVADELEIATLPDESTEDTQNTTTEEGADEGESKEIDLTLKGDQDNSAVNLTPREIEANKIKDSWLSNVILGKKEIAQAPKWLQPWLEEQVATVTAGRSLTPKEEAREAAREEIAFQNLQRSIGPQTKAVAEALKAEFVENVEKYGMPKVVALQKAIKAVGIESNREVDQEVKEAEKRGIKKGQMALPASGLPKSKKSGEKTSLMDVAKSGNQREWNQRIKELDRQAR